MNALSVLSNGDFIAYTYNLFNLPLTKPSGQDLAITDLEPLLNHFIPKVYLFPFRLFDIFCRASSDSLWPLFFSDNFILVSSERCLPLLATDILYLVVFESLRPAPCPLFFFRNLLLCLLSMLLPTPIVVSLHLFALVNCKSYLDFFIQLCHQFNIFTFSHSTFHHEKCITHFPCISFLVKFITICKPKMVMS